MFLRPPTPVYLPRILRGVRCPALLQLPGGKEEANQQEELRRSTEKEEIGPAARGRTAGLS